MASCGSIFTIMFEPVNGYDVSWSPDGTTLAIIAIIDGRDQELFLVDSNGRNLRQLTTLSYSAYINNLRWSPDSGTLYYQTGFMLPDNPWYSIDLEPYSHQSFFLFSNNAVDPFENPFALDAGIEASITADRSVNMLHVASVCNNPNIIDAYEEYDFIALQNCWHDLKVYSVETGEMVWSIGRYRYRMARFGLLRTLDPVDLLIISSVLFVLGFIFSIPVLMKSTPDPRKQKEKS